MQAGGQPPTAVVIAGDEEIRVLFRGLLRLHHFRVLGEAENEGAGIELIRTHNPSIVVVDTNLAQGTVASLLTAARAIAPTIRAVLVAPHARPTGNGVSGNPDAVLQRPFRIRDFAVAVGAQPMTPPASS
jgi:AmiR/NasT family two-component response regulator